MAADDGGGGGGSSAETARPDPRPDPMPDPMPAEDAGPDGWANLDELAASRPVADPAPFSADTLEDRRRRSRELRPKAAEPVTGHDLAAADQERHDHHPKRRRPAPSRLATQFYTLSYLVFFSLWGTLARLGLTALTRYPDAPVDFSTVWANFAGCIVMGFLVEDRRLFRHEWGEPSSLDLAAAQRGGGGGSGDDAAAAAKAHLAAKKTIPLYIGLATGFCGSFTSFSSFMRDVFLAIAGDLGRPGGSGGGRALMAALAVVVVTVSLSLSGLVLGAHAALAAERALPSLPYAATRRFVDPAFALLGWGCWLGAVLLTVFPPREDWRGRATLALVFSPPGCLLRFWLALWLNGRRAAFPLGTFAANAAGTAVLGMAWDLEHVPVGGVVGCQVLAGVADGFCGCLTTVSTWAAELGSLRRRHAYVYGGASVLVSFALLVLIMGGLRWTHGFRAPACG